MSREYVFNHYSSLIDISKEDHKPVWNSKWKSFLWDEGINGITLRQEVFSHGDVNEEKTVKIRLAIIKDKDCQDLMAVTNRYNQWKDTKGDISSSIKINSTSYQKISDLYSKDFQNLSKEILEKIIRKIDVDYTMPVGQSEDILTLTIPINCDMLEANTLYRIGIFECDAIPSFCHEWSSFEFFRSTMPVEDMFVPYSAYLKVRKPLQGKLYFDKAINYRHYKDFNSDIHYDRICMEVEVNPTLVCFELHVKCNKNELPLFSIIMKSENVILHRCYCRVFPIKGTNRIVAFCPLSVEDFHITSYNEITASLQVFDHAIANFSFLTNKTEQGVLNLNL